MLFKSALITDASGSIGGMTASRNRGGAYLRARVVPVNPNTTFQQAVRSIVSALTSLWVNTLTVAERDAWTSYAEAVQVTNRLGNLITLTGLNMYIRFNVPAQQAGFARQDAAPIIFNLGDFSAPSYVPVAAAQQVSVAFTDTDEWVDEDDAAMLIYVSRPQNPSINFFKGPYRFTGSIDGDLALPPATPQLFGVPFPIAVGQKLFARAQVIRADGRLSSEARDGVIILA